MRSSDLIAMLVDSRTRTLELVNDLSDEQMRVPLLGIINPPVWEIGHVAWFQEKWVLRHLRGEPPVRADADALWDSIAIPHDDRWELPLPSRETTLGYMQEVFDRVIQRLPSGEIPDEEAYFHWLVVMHEDMHDEAFTYTRQTLGYPAPKLSTGGQPACPAAPVSGDASFPGGTFLLGAAPGETFVFDNEKWAHQVEVEPFAMARSLVTNGEFREFVDDGGYKRPEWWSEEGRRWREREQAEHPIYWIPDPSGWLERRFDQVAPLREDLPVIHVNYYEAEAFCRWAGRRLPTEAEWEMAACWEPGSPGAKRKFPWGDEPPTGERAHMDAATIGPAPANALPAGDSASGIRQMIGNVWEWTSSDFLPYPGFVVDPYKEYSEPWFGSERKVLRGGCWATRSRLIRNTWRNFFPKDRRDIFAGFRTCAL